MPDNSNTIFPQVSQPATADYIVPEKNINEQSNQDQNGVENFPEQSKSREAKRHKDIHEIVYDAFKWTLTNIGPLATAAGHAYAAGSDIVNYKDSAETSEESEGVDKLALNSSKAIMTTSCVLNGLEALRENRLWEAMSRFIEPLFIIVEKRVEDLNLARGIGLGISQMVEAGAGIVEQLKKNMGLKKVTQGQDHDLNLQALYKLTSETLSGGLFGNRRFLTGFTLENIQEKFSLFFKNFKLSALSILFDSSKGNIIERYEKFLKVSGVKHIQELCEGDKEKDKGHTKALSGYMMTIGSILGYIDKGSKGLFYKLGGTLRNLGGMVADISIFGHPDPYFNVAAIFLTISTVMDTLQRFIPQSLSKLVLPWSNISMATYNIGAGIYLNRSDMKTNKKETVKTYDTDIASQPRRYAQAKPEIDSKTLAKELALPA